MTPEQLTCWSKRRFGSKQKAEVAIYQIRRQEKRGRASLYSYRCPVCGDFHLSHHRKFAIISTPTVAA